MDVKHYINRIQHNKHIYLYSMDHRFLLYSINYTPVLSLFIYFDTQIDLVGIRQNPTHFHHKNTQQTMKRKELSQLIKRLPQKTYS